MDDLSKKNHKKRDPNSSEDDVSACTKVDTKAIKQIKQEKFNIEYVKEQLMKS